MGKVVRDQRVVEFVEARIGGNFDKCVPVGWEDENGHVVAGAVFERFNGRNVFFHGAAETGKLYSRVFLAAIAHTAFVQLGAQRITTVTQSSNVAALNWDRVFGFTEEARLKQAAHDGSDSVYLVLWRKDCRWLKQ